MKIVDNLPSQRLTFQDVTVGNFFFTLNLRLHLKISHDSAWDFETCGKYIMSANLPIDREVSKSAVTIVLGDLPKPGIVSIFRMRSTATPRPMVTGPRVDQPSQEPATKRLTAK
jgi:hypothetical protein